MESPDENVIHLAAHEQARQSIVDFNKRERSFRVAGSVAASLGLCVAAAIGVESMTDDDKPEIGYTVPYVPEAQTAIESVDDVLMNLGKIALPGAYIFVGISMYRGGSRNRWASNDLDSTGNSQSLYRRTLQTVSAGSVPVIASFGAGLATFSTAIGGAITEGPSEPIESISSFAPGESWIVQHDNAKPMVQSSISPELKGAIAQEATEQGIGIATFNLHLGDITYENTNGNINYANLTVGVPTTKSMPIYINRVNCDNVPVAIDEAASIATGSTIELDGLRATVVAQQENLSAVNRIGVTIDERLLAECLDKGPNNAHAIILDTGIENAEQILETANANKEVATVISKDQYIANSEDFWRANVKPITNVLSVSTLLLAGVAMAGDALRRMSRSRRQWAQKMADGMPLSTIRSTELLRSAKEGLFGSHVGVLGAVAISPLVGIFEAGLHVSTGPRAWLVGAAVGILGPMLGTTSRFFRLDKTIDKSRDTRGL